MAIAGLVFFSGEDERADARRSLRAMGGAGPVVLARSPGVSIATAGCGPLAPIEGEGGRYLAAFAGRLDNREGLSRRLQIAEGRKCRDAELLVRACQRWGDDFADQMIGEFAFALWDETRRRLVLGRDALGCRPLHFWRGPNCLFFASEPRGLLAQPAVPRAIDPVGVARWLALLPATGTGSLHAGIERVPPGHVVIADEGGCRLYRYWRPENLAPVRLRGDADYARALRDLLDQAVACRLPATGETGISMSGGLDSTSVAVLAARHLAEQGRRLTVFTAVPSAPVDAGWFPGRICDEGAAAASVVARHPNMDHVLIPNDALSWFDAQDRAACGSDRPVLNPGNAMWAEAILRAAKARRLSVLMDGGMGNMTISYDGLPWLAQLCRAGDGVQLAGQIFALWRNGYSLASLLNQAVGPILPRALRHLAVRAMGRRPPPGLHDFSAIHPDFLRRLGLADEALEIAGSMHNTEAGRRGDPRLAVIQRNDRGLSYPHQRRNGGVERADPTCDRRVVEFCLAIPPGQFLRGGQPRSLIRRAMADLLPAPLLRDRRRGLQAADWHRAATAARPEMLAEIDRLQRSAFARECLDLPRLRRLLENWPADGWSDPAIVDQYQHLLGRGLSLGRFVRRFEGANE
ncbi:MAG: asparagine synthase-related protein [Azospirillaceae bacterium]|nr:asparagine synthase-related protein [Azospirillaceae bacterium]